jgi:hypothetical protein
MSKAQPVAQAGRRKSAAPLSFNVGHRENAGAKCKTTVPLASWRYMQESSGARFYLKWFSILWTICAIAIVLISHVMIVYDWSPVMGLVPFDVRNSAKVLLLLAPGAAGAGIHLLLRKTKGA